MTMNNLILAPDKLYRKAVNDFHSHLNNRVDGIENEVGYIMIEKLSNPVGFDVSLVFDQVNSTLLNRCFMCFW